MGDERGIRPPREKDRALRRWGQEPQGGSDGCQTTQIRVSAVVMMVVMMAVTPAVMMVVVVPSHLDVFFRLDVFF